jgi:hypothetical protein
MATITPVGYTISYPDGSGIGQWISWMAYFDTIEEAKKKATDHITFLKERGHDVVLVTLTATI